MLTAIVQIEAILNFRPLKAGSSELIYFKALTPDHFAIHRPPADVQEPDLGHLLKRHNISCSTYGKDG